MINEAEEKIIPFNNPTITSLPVDLKAFDHVSCFMEIALTAVVSD